jgi:hypothetical protein
MTTTDSFQKVPDFFTSKQDVKPVQTNPRYSNYNQTHFTAGDIEQFEMFRDRSNGSNPTKKIDLDSTRKLYEEVKKSKNMMTDSSDKTKETSEMETDEKPKKKTTKKTTKEKKVSKKTKK